MIKEMMVSKIHRATVTDADLNYWGSITIDKDLMDAAGLEVNQKVQIVNNNNGARFETYVIPGERGKGDICLNGAAARLVQKGDIIIVIGYGFLDDAEREDFATKVILVDENNKISRSL